MQMNHEKRIQEQMGCLLWEDEGERDDVEWLRDWRTLLVEECFSLSGISSSHFCMLWPVRDMGDREEYLWKELASLRRLKRIAPVCAEQIISEITGAYLIVRGLESFGIELYSRKLFKVENKHQFLLCENESPETAAYLNAQETRLVEAVRKLGITFTEEDYLWQFYRFNHPNLDNSLYFWREFGKLWMQLTGRKLRPDLSHNFVCRHLMEVVWPEYRMKNHEQQVVYAFQEVGVFRNAAKKCGYICNAMDRMVKEESQAGWTLLQRGIYTGKELQQKARNEIMPDWMMPILILAVYGYGIFAQEKGIS